MELFKALFIVGLAKSILTSEILLELENLQDFSLIVEVTNLNIDCAKCSYFWNQSNNTDVLFKDVLIRYRYSGIGGFSNETYWKLWETARNDEKIARLENTHWAGFNVFILHSEQFPLYQPFYLQEDLCHDFFPVSTTSNDVITIKSHPLENINIHTIHRVFAQTYQLYRLETHKVFEYIRNYLEVFNKIKNSLGPITRIEEDTKALFYQKNSDFEELFKSTVSKLFALKSYIAQKELKKAEKILLYFKNFKAFSRWVEELPVKTSTLIVNFTVFFLFMINFLITSRVVLAFLSSNHNKTI